MRGQISGIGSPAYAGEFTEVAVPGEGEIPVGDDIVIRVDGYLTDSSKSWADFWSGAFTAEGNGEKDCRVFRGTGKTIGPEGAQLLSLGSMPDHSVDITLRLWANEAYWSPGVPPGF